MNCKLKYHLVNDIKSIFIRLEICHCIESTISEAFGGWANDKKMFWWLDVFDYSVRTYLPCLRWTSLNCWECLIYGKVVNSNAGLWLIQQQGWFILCILNYLSNGFESQNMYCNNSTTEPKHSYPWQTHIVILKIKA